MMPWSWQWQPKMFTSLSSSGETWTVFLAWSSPNNYFFLKDLFIFDGMADLQRGETQRKIYLLVHSPTWPQWLNWSNTSLLSQAARRELAQRWSIWDTNQSPYGMLALAGGGWTYCVVLAHRLNSVYTLRWCELANGSSRSLTLCQSLW